VATAVIMPRQGQSVESCLIGMWYKNKGDKVSVGDVLFTYETDKATFEEESKVEGIMLDIFFEEGEDVECLTNVCVIGKEGESTLEFKPAKQGDGSSVPASEKQGVISSVPASEKQEDGSPFLSNLLSELSGQRASAGSDGIVNISPRAKRLAEKTLADLRYVIPTGPNGRVIVQDVQAVLSQGHRSAEGCDASVSGQRSAAGGRGRDGAEHVPQVHAGDYEIVALTNVRKYIAKAMRASLSNSAQLTSHSSFDATDVFELRKKLKSMDSNPELAKITVTDIIIYAASRVLPKHRSINAHFLGDKMALFNNAHIGVAVDTPRGLLVPTIFNANSMLLSELSAHAKILFEKCKKGSIEPDLLKGASFTISNLGSLGVEMFTPILNPPQTGILGICNTIERTKNGKPYLALGLSITYDHQALDGADSARFLRDLVQYLESFSSHFLTDGGL